MPGLPERVTAAELDPALNTKGIPRVEFIKDIGSFVNEKKDITTAFEEVKVLYTKYQTMKEYLLKERDARVSSLPELESNLGIVEKLKKMGEDGVKEFPMFYQLGDLVYAKAKVTKLDSINLWLGGDVMAEYKLDEAEKLLRKNIDEIKAKIDEVDGNLHFLQEQMETAQCNMTRIQNYASLIEAGAIKINKKNTVEETE